MRRPVHAPLGPSTQMRPPVGLSSDSDMKTPKPDAPTLAAALPGRTHCSASPRPDVATCRRNGASVISSVALGVSPAGGATRENVRSQGEPTQSRGSEPAAPVVVLVVGGFGNRIRK